MSSVEGLFAALSSCSALHDSLLPSGEPSSFGFFPAHDDIDDEDEDDGGWEEDAEGQEDGGDGGPGRVRSDFRSGGGPQARFRPY